MEAEAAAAAAAEAARLVREPDTLVSRQPLLIELPSSHQTYVVFVQEEEARLAPWMWVLSSFIPETAIYQAAGGYQLARAIDSRALRAVIARIATFLTLAEVLALAASSRTNTYVTIALRLKHFKFAPKHIFPI